MRFGGYPVEPASVPFKKLLRVTLGVAFLTPFATCTDFTAPRAGRGVQVSVAPTFSKAATFAKALYSAAGIEFDNVRVLIVRGESEVLKDTSLAFSPASTELTLPLLVVANPGEEVTVTLEYRSGDLVMYSGTSTVTTVAPGAPLTTSPTPVLIIPVGPGSSATSVEISPASGTFPVASPVDFTATAFGVDLAPIPNSVFGWTVDDATIASVSRQGVVTPTSKGGVAKIRATTLNEKFAEATVTFVTAPASLVIQSGGGQSAPALDALPAPIIVKVLDANGVAVPGATVSFAVATGGGSVAVVTGVSNSSGLASVNWTLGATVGSQSITATVGSVTPLSIAATATERPARILAFAQQPSRVGMNASIAPAVTVKALDDKGNVVVGYAGAVTLAFDLNPTTATLGGTLTVNAVAGIATFSNLTVNKAGEGYKLKASAAGLTTPISNAFGINQVASSIGLAGGGNQIAAINTQLDQIVVKVVDANGAGVPGVAVAFAVASGGGSLVVDNGTTDATGLARATWTLGSTIGTQSITASSGTLIGSPLSIPATATAPAATTLAFVQQPSTVAMNAAMSPAVTVKAVDANGQTVTTFTGNVSLTLGTNPTGATLNGTTTVAAVAGVATFSTLSVSKPGTGYKLSAGSGTVSTIASNAFTVSPVASSLSLFAGDGQTAAIRSTLSQIAVKVADANGEGVAGVTVTFAVASGGGSIVVDNGITDANGLARVTWTLGNTIGSQSITATSGTLSGSPLTINATGTALPAVALAFAQQPSSVLKNVMMSPAVTVRAVDVDGNVVTGFTGNITLALSTNPTGATLGGTLSVAAVSGVASFPTLTVNNASAGYKLGAAATGLTSAQSDAFAVTSLPPVALAFVVQPSNVIEDIAISPPVQVKMVDADGNTVFDVPTPVTLGFHYTGIAPDASITGTGPVTTVNGIATFNNVVIGTPLSSIRLKAKATGLDSAVSNAFSISLTPGVSKVWNGSFSINWNDASNWSPSGVPAAQDSVTIVSALNQPVITTSAYATAILVETGATLIIRTSTASITTPKIYNKGTLQLSAANLYGSIENRGTVIADSLPATVYALQNIGTSSKLQVVSRRTTGARLDISTAMTNEGTIELNDTDGQSALLSVTDSIVNRSGATISILQGSGNGDRDMNGILRNYGAINVASSQGLDMAHPSKATSVNTGTITVTNGSLAQFFDDSTTVFDNTGVIAMNSYEWDTDMGRITLRGGTVTGTGFFLPQRSQLDIDFSKFSLIMKLDDNSRFTNGSLTVPATQTARLGGGVLTQAASITGTLQILNTIHGFSFLNGGATVNSGGTLEVQNSAQVGASFNPGTTLNVALGGKVTINGSGQNVELDIPRSMTNSGTIEMTSTGSKYAAGLFVSGTVTNAVGANLSALGGAGGRRYIQGTLDNKGTLTVDGTTYLELRQSKTTHLSSGTINLSNAIDPGRGGDSTNNSSIVIVSPDLTGQAFSNTGTINIGTSRTLNVGSKTTFSNGSAGLIGGFGTIRLPDDATFTNAGRIAPGALGSLGVLTFSGNLNLGSGILEIDIGGLPETGQFDQLIVGGHLVLGGTLNVTKVKGFNDQGQWDKVISPSSYAGSFATITPSPWYSFLSELFPGFLGVGNFQFFGPPLKPPM